MKLSDEQKNLLKLIKRSQKENGWAIVGIKEFVPNIKELPNELVDIDYSMSEGTYYTRLTPTGEILVKYL